MNEANLEYRVLELLLEQRVDDDTCDLALAAVSGTDELDAALAGRAPERPESGETSSTPAGAFLSSISVRGFRGVGAETKVNLNPGPGLTIVSGRNGSGKSSLAEGLEYALTSTTYRWRQGTRFTERWRNLHRPEPCRITVDLAQEGVGRSTIAVEWAADETAEGAGRVTFQTQGRPRQEGLGDLGWAAALDTYRPLLSYEELGGLLRETGSSLHDKLKMMLGLDALTDADRRLKALLDPIKQPMAAANRERQALRKRAADAGEERAQRAAKLLSKTSPDLVALLSLVTGAVDTAPQRETLQRITAIQLPSVEQVTAAPGRLTAAVADAAEFADQASALEDQRRRLLEHALSYREAFAEDITCPVCQQGTLDSDWRSRTTEVLAATNLLDEQRRAARVALQQARSEVRELVSAPPSELSQAAVGLTLQPATAQAWMRWSSPPADDADLVKHLTTAFGPLVAAMTDWQAEAAEAAALQQETWQPLAVDIGAWIVRHEQAQAAEDRRERLENAKKALLAVETTIRAERMGPIVHHARAIWAQLRQESNVDLDAIELTGQATHRRVDITAAVDGVAAGALSVMSQGELHALALALFLPRAALPDSPFRFIVLDDPVQAMDPSKVHGLAQVLNELAGTHQVIVLSHDDRLAQAGRRLTPSPRILEVMRNPDSEVVVQESFSPTRRHLSDADALGRDPGLPEATCRAILPGVLRQALEAACYERHFTEQLRSGSRIVDVEATWTAISTTSKRVQLALGDQDLGDWQSRFSERRRALQICGSGGHRPLTGDIEEAIVDVRRAVHDIEGHVR